MEKRRGNDPPWSGRNLWERRSERASACSALGQKEPAEWFPLSGTCTANAPKAGGHSASRLLDCRRRGSFGSAAHSRRDAADAGVFGKSFLGKWKKSPLLPSGEKKCFGRTIRKWKDSGNCSGIGRAGRLRRFTGSHAGVLGFSQRKGKFLALFQISLYQHTPWNHAEKLYFFRFRYCVRRGAGL